MTSLIDKGNLDFFRRSLDEILPLSLQTLPLVSIVVPVYNPGAVFSQLLNALSNQDYPAKRFEILLIDDGSTIPPNYDMASSLSMVRHYRQRNMGSYAARNLGIRHAQGDVIVFTDTDCIPEPDWLRQGISRLIDHNVDMIAGEIRFIVTDPNSVIEMYDVNFHLRQKYYAEHYNFGVTANLFVRRSIFERMGTFDSNRRSGGDYFFCTTAVERGASLEYGPEAVIWHPTRRSFASLLRKRIRIAQGFWNLMPGLRYKLAYLLPTPLSPHPQAGQQIKLSTLPLTIQLRFILLHYIIETLRCLICTSFLIVDATRLWRSEKRC